ncbi:terminase large subunit, partial [Acinetobacter baumannii]|nr:terminase large subunit [Acinetobacter baumannii]
EASDPWIDSDTWMNCEQDFDPEDLAGEECYGGLDLSGSRDLTALALYFPKSKKLLVEFWTPKDSLMERAKTDHVPYDAWLRNGFIHAPPGKAVNYGFVAVRIGELA